MTDKDILEQKVKQEEDDKVSFNLIEKIATLFKKETEADVLPAAPVDVLPGKEKDVDIEKEIDEKVQQKLDELIPSLKKKEKEQLEQEKKELEKQKKELEELNVIETLVDSNYSEFVKFQAEKTNVTIEQFLEENKQYAKSKIVPVDSKKAEGTMSIVDEILEKRKKTGFK